jgi:hypothetical protein
VVTGKPAQNRTDDLFLFVSGNTQAAKTLELWQKYPARAQPPRRQLPEKGVDAGQRGDKRTVL